MDAYITASRTYYIAAEDDSATQNYTVKFFTRQPEAAVDAAHRWQINQPVAVVRVDTHQTPYALEYALTPPTGVALADLFDEAARGAAQRQQSHLHG